MIGILALQGGFQAHQKILDALGVPHREVRLKRDFEGLDALILPGGESTTMLKLLDAFDLFEPLKALGNSGLPILGTCAGAILMSAEVRNPNQKSFAWIPTAIIRNAYGSQRESFLEAFPLPAWDLAEMSAFFIRAPQFIEPSEDVEIISTHDDEITGVSYRNFTAVTYHPELTDDTRFHEAWLSRNVKGYTAT